MVCDELTEIVIGSVFATLAFCLIIFGTILIVLWRKRKLCYSQSKDLEDQEGRRASQSSCGSGIQNHGYVKDKSNGNGLIMMMSSRQSSMKSARRKVSESSKEEGLRVVSLTGGAASGLGFEVTGDHLEGILVGEVDERGPAKESGLIKEGDRVVSVTISFKDMTHEDALKLFNCCSPYPITLTLAKANKQREVTPLNQAEISQTLEDSSDTASSGNQQTDEEVSKNGDSDDLDENMVTTGENNNDGYEEDDDTRRRAPDYLPASIRSLVESKRSANQAVSVIEEHTQNSKSLQLTPGAQSALELIIGSIPEESPQVILET